jgi:hypothetical protein
MKYNQYSKSSSVDLSIYCTLTNVYILHRIYTILSKVIIMSETIYTEEKVLAAMSELPELPYVIAQRLGCCTRTVTRAIKPLETDGKVKRLEIGRNINAWSKVIV